MIARSDISRFRHLVGRIATAVMTLVMLAGVTSCRHNPRSTVYPDPEKFQVRGIDISAHNGDVDFDAVRSDGISFVILKATEGTSFKDRKFTANYLAARRAGLKVGAYHFFRFDASGYMQGLNLVNSLSGRQLDLPIAIDIEEWTNPNHQATELIRDRLDEMIDYLETHGYRVMIYSNKNGHDRFIRGRFEGFPLWICSLASEPEELDWTLWQATHNGGIRGIKGPVDVNAFRGDTTEWMKFLKSAIPAMQ